MLPNLFSHNMLKITYYDINIFSLLKTKKYTYKYLKNKKFLTEKHFSITPEAYHYVWFLRFWSHFFSHYVEGLFSRAETGLIVTLQRILPNMDDMQNSSWKSYRVLLSWPLPPTLYFNRAPKNWANFQKYRYEKIHLNRDKDITDLIFVGNSQWNTSFPPS